VIYLVHDENPTMYICKNMKRAYFLPKDKGRVGLFTTNMSLTVTVCILHRYNLVVDFRQGKNGTHHQHTGN
jgi:hypothetical protein